MTKHALSWWRDYRWQIVTVMLLGSIVNYVDRVNLSFATIHIRQEFGLSTSQLGYLLAAWMWPYAIANLPSGWLIDKFGISKVFLCSIVIWSLATIAGGFMHNYTGLYWSRIVLGIAEAPFFVIGAKVIQLYFQEDKRGLAAGVMNTAMAFG